MSQPTALRRALAGTMLLLAIGSCAQTPRPAPASPPTPAPPPVIRPAPAPLPPPPLVAVAGRWDELPVIEGGWVFDAVRRSARFLDDSGLERAGLECAVPGTSMRLRLADDSIVSVEVLTSAGASSFSVQRGSALLAIDDETLDRMAFSRGRFALRTSALLVLPVQAEIGRAIENCRG